MLQELDRQAHIDRELRSRLTSHRRDRRRRHHPRNRPCHHLKPSNKATSARHPQHARHRSFRRGFAQSVAIWKAEARREITARIVESPFCHLHSAGVRASERDHRIRRTVKEWLESRRRCLHIGIARHVIIDYRPQLLCVNDISLKAIAQAYPGHWPLDSEAYPKHTRTDEPICQSCGMRHSQTHIKCSEARSEDYVIPLQHLARFSGHPEPSEQLDLVLDILSDLTVDKALSLNLARSTKIALHCVLSKFKYQYT